ncbi:MAG: glycosyl hydrolase, partial [Spartobacteria bacterium]
APNLIRPKHVPAGLGKGYDYDVCNEEVLLTRLSVKDGKIVLPDGMSYRVLVLPDTTKMPAPVAKKLRELVLAGATVIGPKPLTDPGLKNHPQCDEEVKKIGEELWGGNTGKGRVFEGKTEREVLLADGVLPDFEAAGANDAFIDFIHRSTPEAEIYFLANRKDRPEKVTASFRQAGRQPELWNPMTGEQRDLPNFKLENGRTSIPLEFDPSGSMFVVFRKPTSATAGEGSNFPVFETVQTLEGPWTVQFDKEWFYPTDGLPGATAGGELVFEKLEDWTKRPEDAVKHFSGAAVYRKTFPVSGLPSPVSKTFLDLGTVGHSAKVRLNGKDLGVVWCNPRRVDITDALKPGVPELEIEVVNSSPTRLIGDAKLPKEQRRTRTNITQFEKPENQTLVPSGLLGPVTLQAISNNSYQRPLPFGLLECGAGAPGL